MQEGQSLRDPVTQQKRYVLIIISLGCLDRFGFHPQLVAISPVEFFERILKSYQACRILNLSDRLDLIPQKTHAASKQVQSHVMDRNDNPLLRCGGILHKQKLHGTIHLQMPEAAGLLDLCPLPEILFSGKLVPDILIDILLSLFQRLPHPPALFAALLPAQKSKQIILMIRNPSAHFLKRL